MHTCTMHVHVDVDVHVDVLLCSFLLWVHNCVCGQSTTETEKSIQSLLKSD